MKITVKGVDALKNKLKQLSKVDVNAAVMKGALRVERDAKIIVPVDTGTLRNSITHVVQGNVGIVGTSIEYAANVELGIGQRRQPYLTPALNMNRAIIKEEIQDELHRQFEKVAK
jgi:phage gpG-like protein